MKSLVEIILQIINRPSTPDVGFVKIYPKSDKNLYFLDSDSMENRVAKYEDTQNLTNDNIASNANIAESKLALDYGTQWLKDYVDVQQGGHTEIITGNGSASSWTITHGLGVKYVKAFYYLTSTDEVIDMKTVAIDDNTCQVSGIVLQLGEQVKVIVAG